MSLHKILKIVALVLSVAGIIFLAIILVKGDEAVTMTGAGVDGFLYLAYITLALTIAFVLFFVIKGIFQKDMKSTLIPVGAFLLILAVSYLLAPGNPMEMRDISLSASDSKWVDTGLYMFYITGFLAIGSMIFNEIKKAIK